MLNWGRRHWGKLLVLTGVAWIVFNIVAISREPLPGASSPDRLSEMIAKALSSNNKDAFEDMLDQDSIGNAYAENYLHKIDGATDISARTAVLNETTIMSVTGKLKGGGDFCSQWQVVQNDGRWLLDAAPPILPSACR